MWAEVVRVGVFGGWAGDKGVEGGGYLVYWRVGCFGTPYGEPREPDGHIL